MEGVFSEAMQLKYILLTPFLEAIYIIDTQILEQRFAIKKNKYC